MFRNDNSDKIRIRCLFEKSHPLMVKTVITSFTVVIVEKVLLVKAAMSVVT